jgi:hypothetical protein
MVLQGSAIGDALSADWIFPTAECFHISAFALSIGTIVMVDLRMMGMGLMRYSAARMVRETELWTLLGLLIVVFSGLVLFASQPRIYYPNPALRFKIAALVVAILYNFTIHRKLALSDASPMTSRLAAGVSVLLWLSVVSGGLFIAFV